MEPRAPHAALTFALAVLLAACVTPTSPEELNERGEQHLYGRGVARDYAEAARLFRRAAEAGHAGAQVNLGYLYETGHGVAQDEQEAVRWYEKAAAQGQPIAQSNLAIMLREGHGTERDLDRALELSRAAAAKGVPQAQTNLGLLYELGEGVERDPAEAARLYTEAAEQGYAPAQANLARLLLAGEGIQPDPERAVELYRSAAAQNHLNALYGLGYVYDNGRGVAEDDAAAVDWYRKAAERGHAESQVRLVDFLLRGEGVPRNVVEARFWAARALAQGYEGDAQTIAGLRVIAREDLAWYLELIMARETERGGDPAGALERARDVHAGLVEQGIEDWPLGFVLAYRAEFRMRHPEVHDDLEPEAAWRMAAVALEDAPGYLAVERAIVLRDLATVLAARGLTDEAAEWKRLSHAVLRETLPPDHPLWEAGGPEDLLRERHREMERLIALDLGLHPVGR